MSIRDIQLSDLGEMEVSIDLAKHLLLERKENVNYVMRCRLEILLALQYGCKQLAVNRGYTVECYGNDVYRNVDVLSDHCSDITPLVYFFNAAHPDCDFARIEIANNEFDKAYQLLDFYIELLEAMFGQLRDERK